MKHNITQKEKPICRYFARTILTIMIEKYKAIYNSITNVREKSSLQ